MVIGFLQAVRSYFWPSLSTRRQARVASERGAFSALCGLCVCGVFIALDEFPAAEILDISKWWILGLGLLPAFGLLAAALARKWLALLYGAWFCAYPLIHIAALNYWLLSVLPGIALAGFLWLYVGVIRSEVAIWKSMKRLSPARLAAQDSPPPIRISLGRILETSVFVPVFCLLVIGMIGYGLPVALKNTGTAYMGEVRYEEAEVLLRRALGIYEITHQGENELALEVMRNLVSLHQNLGRLDEAEEQLKHLHLIEEKTFGPHDTRLVRSLGDLAFLYETQGRHEDAATLYRRCLTLLEEEGVDPLHPDVTYIVSRLATEYRRTGRYEDAEPLYQRALSAAMQDKTQEPPRAAALLHDLAKLHQDKGDYVQAEAAFTWALDIKRAVGHDTDVATIQHSLGILKMDQGHYAAAESLFQSTLRYREGEYGANHTSVAIVKADLAHVHRMQGKYDVAEVMAEEALSIYEIWEPDHPNLTSVYVGLAGIYKYQGRYDEAENLFRKAITNNEKSLGPKHPYLAADLNNLAQLHLWRWQYDEAEPLLRRALKIIEEAGSPDHGLAPILGGLASIFHAKGDYDRAEASYQRSLAISRQNLDPNHPHVATGLYRLALLHRSQGRFAEAKTLLRRALEINEKALGQSHSEVATILYGLATVEAAQQDPEEALTLILQSTHIDEGNIAQVFRMVSEQRKMGFLRTLVPRFDFLLSLTLVSFPTDSEAVRSAFDAIIRRKGMVSDAVSRERRALSSMTEPDAVELIRQFQAVAARLARLTLAVPADVAVDEYRGRLSALEVERENLEKAIARKGFTGARERGRHVNGDHIASLLEPESILVEYARFRMVDLELDHQGSAGRDKYVAFVVPAGDKANPSLVDLGMAQDVERTIKEFRDQVVGATKSILELGEAEAERRLMEKGQRLHELVVAPVTALFPKAKTLYLVPDGELNLIPFGTLSDRQRRYLAETHQLNYLSAARDLLRFFERVCPDLS